MVLSPLSILFITLLTSSSVRVLYYLTVKYARLFFPFGTCVRHNSQTEQALEPFLLLQYNFSTSFGTLVNRAAGTGSSCKLNRIAASITGSSSTNADMCLDIQNSHTFGCLAIKPASLPLIFLHMPDACGDPYMLQRIILNLQRIQPASNLLYVKERHVTISCKT